MYSLLQELHVGLEYAFECLIVNGIKEPCNVFHWNVLVLVTTD